MIGAENIPASGGAILAANHLSVVDSVFPLSEVRAAHRRMEKREQFGKIILYVA